MRDRIPLQAGLRPALAALCLLAGLSACGGDDTDSMASPVQLSAAPAVADTATAAPAPAAMAATTAGTGTLSSAAATSVTAAATTYPILRGINISGGEFGGGKAPGKMFYNYIYPTNAEIDYYARLGFTVIRVPFMWERIQPTLYGPLSTVDRQYLRDVITYATGRGLTVVLDMHNYAQRAIGADYQTVVDVGSSQVPVKALSDAWIKLAYEYRSNGKVWIGLMNEPHTMTAAKWWPMAKQLITDLRAGGLYNKLLVPGTAWTGAYSWVTSGNAANATGINDPVNNYAFEVHQYLDADSSGTSATCVKGAGARVADVISWAKSKKVMLFMGEMAAAGGTQCGIEYRDMLNRMEASGVFRGWTAWGGGTWWVPTYPFRTITNAWPDTSTTTVHMKYLLEYVKK